MGGSGERNADSASPGARAAAESADSAGGQSPTCACGETEVAMHDATSKPFICPEDSVCLCLHMQLNSDVILKCTC